MATAQTQTVAVTGAAGTVGAYVIDQLLEKGYKVVAIDRPGAKLPEPTDRVAVRAGDLTDPEFCDRCLEGADHVIHTAAVIDISWTYEQLKPINVDAVRYLFEAARARRLLTFVHFSSGSIYDHHDRLIDETTAFKATSPYEQTKIESEELLRSYHGRGGPAYVILRPSLIYGPRGRLLGAALVVVPPLLLLFTGEPVLGFVGGPRLNWVHAEDVARAAVYTMEHEQCWGEAFNVADDTPLPIGEVVNAVTRAYGLEIGRTVPMPPKWLAKLFYRFIDTDLFFQVLNGTGGPLWAMIRARYGCEDQVQMGLDRSTSTYFIRDVVFDNCKLRNTGFHFKWPDIRTAFPGVLAWYQDHSWAPRLRREDVQDLPETWGFQFRQRLRGTFGTEDGRLVDQPLEFNVTGRASSVRAFARDNIATLRGTITMDGFATDARLEGTLEAALLNKGRFIYEFDFTSDAGQRCHFRGIESVEPVNLLQTMTTMELVVDDEAGARLATGMAKFDIRADLLRMAASFRPRY
jgi:nucleoside-diphosphate-sugar epimerase